MRATGPEGFWKPGFCGSFIEETVEEAISVAGGRMGENIENGRWFPLCAEKTKVVDDVARPWEGYIAFFIVLTRHVYIAYGARRSGIKMAFSVSHICQICHHDN